MASRVNSKFILIVGAVVTVVVVAGAYVAVESVRKTGDDYIALGDQALGEKKYEEAIMLYGKAVYKDQRNPAWLTKWVGAMEQEVPKTRAAYRDRYFKEYAAGLQRLAEAQPTDFEAHRRWLNERWKMLNAGGRPPLGELEGYVKFVDQMVGGFTGKPEDKARLLRYRGLTSLRILAIKPDMKDDEVMKIRGDLAGALAAAPDDEEIAVALAQLDWFRVVRAHERGDKPEAATLNAEIATFIEKFITDHPKAMDMRRQELRLRLQMAALAGDPNATTQTVLQDRQERVREMGATLLAQPPEAVDPADLPDALFMIRAALPDAEYRELSDRIVAHALKGHAQNPEMLVYVAQTLMDRAVELQNRSREERDVPGATAALEEAIRTLDTVVTLPDRPLSFDGILLYEYRSMATRLQTDAAFTLWEIGAAAKNAETMASAANRAREFRNKYVERVEQGASDVRVIPIDAKLALIDGDVRSALALLDRYNKATGEGQIDQPTMALTARLQLRQNNTGAARKGYERVLQTTDEQQHRGLRLEAIAQLAKLAEAEKDYPELLKWLRALQAYNPDSQPLAAEVAALETLIAQQANPNIRVTGEAGRVLRIRKILEQAQDERSGVGADPMKAAATIRAALKEKELAREYQLHTSLIQVLNEAGRRDETLAAIDAALALFPDGDQNAGLRSAREKVERADPLADALTRIDDTSLTPLQRHLSRHELFRSLGRAEESAQELAEAVKIDAADPLVIDAQFEAALRVKDKAELERLAKLAEEKNLDQVNGQLYRARLMMVDRKLPDAVVLLRGVVERDRTNALAWRLLGATHVLAAEQLRSTDAGKARDEYTRATEAFQRAYDIRPHDIFTINGYVQSLAETGRLAEALAIARKSEVAAGRDPAFVEMFLRLESGAPGGDPERAIQLRENLAQLRPDDAGNQMNLAMLLMSQKRFDDAKAIIDRFRADPARRDDVASLDARWQLAQGNIEEARKVVDAYLAGVPAEKLDESAYLTVAELFKTAGRADVALAYLEKGRPIQDKTRLSIDREMGDVAFAAGDMAKAVAAYSGVLEAGSPDPDSRVAKRLLECYVKQRNWAAFDEQVKALGEAGQKDSTVLVLVAEAALGQSDPARAQRSYDQAVASDPSNPVVFLKRGAFYARSPDKERDAIADLEQAVRLAPNSPMPLIQLADLHARAGRGEQALRQADRALALVPNDRDLRLRIVALRTQTGDLDGALDLVEQAIKLEPESVDWRLQGARVAMDNDRMDRAVGYLAEAWGREKTMRTAIPYVTALLGKKDKDVATAEKVVNDPTLVELATKDPTTLMPYRLLRAMALLRNNRPADADGELALAVASLNSMDIQQVDLFMAGLGSTFEEDLAKQIAALGRLNAKTPLTGFLKVRALMLGLQDEKTRANTARELEAFADAAEDTNLKAPVYRLLGSVHFQTGDYAASVAAYQKLLALAPNDLEALNNAAYIMASRTGQAAQARPLADKALELAPDSSTVLDTAGTVYHGLKDLPKAAEMFTRALEKATSDNERAPVLLHLSKVLIEQGRKADARPHLTTAQRLLAADPRLNEQFGPELKDLLRQIDGQ